MLQINKKKTLQSLQLAAMGDIVKGNTVYYSRKT